MSVYTEVLTDDIIINGKVNDLSIDWPNIAYKSDIDNITLSTLNTADQLTIGDESSGVVLKSNSSTKYDIVFPANQGSSGSVLQNDGTGNMVWAEMVSNSTSPLPVSDDYNLTTVDKNVMVDASSKSIIITLPDVSDYSEVFIVVGNISGNNNVTINAISGYTFDGDEKLSFVLTKKHQKIQLKCLGTNVWYTI
jgi:hypothetical protein